VKLTYFHRRISEAGGAKFWYHGIRNCFITVAERELMLPHALTKRLVNHTPPRDVTEGYAADWTIGQLREPAQRIAGRIEEMTGSRPAAPTANGWHLGPVCGEMSTTREPARAQRM